MSFIASLDDIDVITAGNWKIVWYINIKSICYALGAFYGRAIMSNGISAFDVSVPAKRV